MCRLYELLDRAESNASRAELCSADRLVSRADATLRDDGCAVEARALRELRLVAPSPLRLVRLPDTLDTARERGVAAGGGNGDCGSDAMTFFSALATACPKRWARDAMAGAETAGRSSDAGEQRRSGVGVAAGRGDGRPREPYCFPRLLQQPGARGELVRLHDAHQHAGEDPTDGEVCDLSEQSHKLLLHVSTSASASAVIWILTAAEASLQRTHLAIMTLFGGSNEPRGPVKSKVLPGRKPLRSRNTQLIESPVVWLADKAADDQRRTGCPPHLWCVNGKLYDLADFAKRHPGGREWLDMTQGHDISELVEVHHFNMKVRRRTDVPACWLSCE